MNEIHKTLNENKPGRNQCDVRFRASVRLPHNGTDSAQTITSICLPYSSSKGMRRGVVAAAARQGCPYKPTTLR